MNKRTVKLVERVQLDTEAILFLTRTFDTTSAESTPSPKLRGASKQQTKENTDWDVDWEAEEESEQPKTSKKQTESLNDLNTKILLFSISRDGKLLVIAHKEVLVIIKDGDKIPHVREQSCDEGDSITQIATLPVQIGRDEVQCIAVGYQSGFIRIYDNVGDLIVSQLLHKAPVTRLKLRSNPVMPGLPPQSEDLSIMYPDGIIACIDGSSLHIILQEHILRGGREGANQAMLSYRKWQLQEQTIVSDLITVGLSGFSPFGTLQPLTTPFRIVGVGKDPMVAFYVPSEKEFRLSTAVAMASSVATKLTSAVFSYAKSWWGGSTQEKEPQEKEIQVEKPVSLPLKWGISDPQRNISTIVIDPTGRLAAASDGFGRVLLFDLTENTITRMWKGYRDAQCAFVQPAGTLKKGAPFELYLAIYAPKRGILEVWRVKHGHRVSIIDVGLGCKLLSTSSPLGAITGDYTPARCYLLYKSGLVEEIIVT